MRQLVGNTHTVQYTGNTELEPSQYRAGFTIFPIADALTVKLNDGSGEVTVPVGGYWEPYVAPVGKITITCAGAFNVVTRLGVGKSLDGGAGTSGKPTARPPIDVERYDTVVGIGDSITQGEYDLAGGMYDRPFRGVKFDTAAVYGTTLENILANINDPIALASGRTLFVVRAGINDVNTLMSGGGVTDGAGGTVTGWNDLTQAQRDTAEEQYRDIIAALTPHGDVALATVTYVDAKGQLSGLPDQGRSLHAGSWNTNLVAPLCQELTPDWYDTATSRPKLDYYEKVLEDITVLDNDNLHFYDDRVWPTPAGGYPAGFGSYTVRKYTQDVLGAEGAIPATPYDSTQFSNRILVNLGQGVHLPGRPAFNRYTNSCDIRAGAGPFNNLQSYNGATTVGMSVSMLNSGAATGHLATLGMNFEEGVQDKNIISSGVNCADSAALELTLTGLSRGVISVIGLQALTYDATRTTTFTFIDDAGTTAYTRESTIDSTAVDVSALVAEHTFDCRASGTLRIQVRQGAGSSRAAINGIQIDMV